VRTQKGLRKDEAHILIRTADAKAHRIHIEHALGSLEHPMSDADIARKFMDLSEPVLGAENARGLLDRAMTLHASADAGSLADYPA
jgi:hypothetical protein